MPVLGHSVRTKGAGVSGHLREEERPPRSWMIVRHAPAQEHCAGLCGQRPAQPTSVSADPNEEGCGAATSDPTPQRECAGSKTTPKHSNSKQNYANSDAAFRASRWNWAPAPRSEPSSEQEAECPLRRATSPPTPSTPPHTRTPFPKPAGLERTAGSVNLLFFF